jgi:hypothetical protein
VPGHVIDLGASLPVLNLDKTTRSKRLRAMQSYASSRQHDAAKHDWDGYARGGGEAYIDTAIQRRLGYVPTNPDPNIPYAARRPACTTSLGGMIVTTFTDSLLGEGRTPTVSAQGDDDTSAYLAAVFAASGSWATLTSTRDIAGACGEAAFLPMVVKHRPAAEALNPAELFVEWTDDPGWIPRLVIEQRKICKHEYVPLSGAVEPIEYWRTRAWDETYAYTYEDIPCEGGNTRRGQKLDAPVPGPLNATGQTPPPGSTDAPKRVADLEERVEHHAGRCPIVWMQNSHNDDDSRAASDYETCEDNVDALDKLLSQIIRGSTANVDPTMVISDRHLERNRWPYRAKGLGQKIETSEVGSASFLTVDGASYEQGWNSFNNLKALVEDRCGIVIVTPETAGSYKSGTALKVLLGRQNAATGRKRRALDTVLKQVSEVWIALGQKFLGSLVMPRRKVVDKTAENREDRVQFVEHSIGEGRWIECAWPPYQDQSPEDINAGVQAAVNASGGRAVLSQETAVKLTATMLGEDPIAEMDRIADEQRGREDAFGEGLDLEGAGEMVAEAGDGLGEDGTDEDVQKQALNGAQVSSLMATLAAIDDTVAPEAAKMAVTKSFPMFDPAEVAGMVDEQYAWRQAKPAPEPPDMQPPRSPVGSGAAEALERQAAPEDQEPDDGEFALEP